VTAGQWRDIWLHEGFACYAEWLWSEHSGGPSAEELAKHHHAQLRAKPQDLLLTDPGARDMFDDRVYKRGALTLHALRGRLGNDNFFALLKDWTSRHRHGTAVTDDFTGLAAKLFRRAAAAAVGRVAVLDGRAVRSASPGASARRIVAAVSTAGHRRPRGRRRSRR
jgi:aminopeptidase N